MKKILGILSVALVMTACNNDGGSTEEKLDSLGNKIDTTAEKVWDSTKETYKDVREEVKDRLDRDSAERKDTVNR
jgi:hypothetical protein